MNSLLSQMKNLTNLQIKFPPHNGHARDAKSTGTHLHQLP